MAKPTLEQSYEELKKLVIIDEEILERFNLTRFARPVQNVYRQLYDKDILEAKQSLAKTLMKHVKELQELKCEQIYLQNQCDSLQNKVNNLQEKVNKLQAKDIKLRRILKKAETSIPMEYKNELYSFTDRLNKKLVNTVYDLTELVNYAFHYLRIDLQDNTDIKQLIERCKNKHKKIATTDDIPILTLCDEAAEFVRQHFPFDTCIESTLEDILEAEKTQKVIQDFYSRLIRQELKSTEKV